MVYSSIYVALKFITFILVKIHGLLPDVINGMN